LRPPKSEVERLFAGVDLAKELFGWDAEYAGRDGFIRGLAETAQWFQDPKNLNRYRPNTYSI
jgi:dTDP-glucose 4,6-dehydratase